MSFMGLWLPYVIGLQYRHLATFLGNSAIYWRRHEPIIEKMAMNSIPQSRDNDHKSLLKGMQETNRENRFSPEYIP